MQEILLWIVALFGLVSIYQNAKRINKSNPRFYLRIASLIISGYTFVVFLLAALGIIAGADVTFYMRWFTAVFMVYFIAEAQNG